MGGCLAPGALLWGVGGVWSQGVPGGDNPQTATAVGSTHPTGMHSCLLLFSSWDFQEDTCDLAIDCIHSSILTKYLKLSLSLINITYLANFSQKAHPNFYYVDLPL